MKPYYEEPGIVIYNCDCRLVLPHLPKVDLVLTDPPYGETSCAWDTRCSGWLSDVSADCLWCFGSFRFFMENLSEFSGWRFAQELIWEKQAGSGACMDRFNRVHEIIVQFYRGLWAEQYRDVPEFPSGDKVSHRTAGRGECVHRSQIDSRPYNDDGMRLQRSVIHARNMKGFASHPTEKPVNVVKLPLSYSCPPGGTVLDPFMGSGTTLVAAKQLGRRAIGIEIEEKYVKIAIERLRQEVLPLEAEQPQPEQMTL